MQLYKFNPIHLRFLQLSDGQKDGLILLSNEEYLDALASEESYTAIVDGKVIACMGVYPYTNNIGKMWSFLSEGSGKHMITLTRAVKKFCTESEYTRLEAAVRQDYKEGHRWVKMLGFTCETPDGMKNYTEDLQTYSLYAYYNNSLD